MIDKNYCMSSFLAFRFIEKDDVDFFVGLKHKIGNKISNIQKKTVFT